MTEYPIASVQSGVLIDDGARAALVFEISGQAATIVMSAEEISALLSVCAGLAAQAQSKIEGPLSVVPVEDWQVGVTTSSAVLLQLVSHNGAAFSYQLAKRQALAIRNAITLATVSEAGGHVPRPLSAHAPTERNIALSELTELRLQCRGDSALLDLVDRCSALIAELDAANDEGREILHEHASAFVDAVRDRLLAREVATCGETP